MTVLVKDREAAFCMRPVRDFCSYFFGLSRLRRREIATMSSSVKDVRAQNVPTNRFFFKLATQKGNDILSSKRRKKKGVTVLVFEIMRCIFRRLRYFKTIFVYTCQQ